MSRYLKCNVNTKGWDISVGRALRSSPHILRLKNLATPFEPRHDFDRGLDRSDMIVDVYLSSSKIADDFFQNEFMETFSIIELDRIQNVELSYYEHMEMVHTINEFDFK